MLFWAASNVVSFKIKDQDISAKLRIKEEMIHIS